MIPKPFTTVAIEKQIDNISHDELIDSLRDFVKIAYRNNFAGGEIDILITSDRNFIDSELFTILVDFTGDPVIENRNLRVFQPFLNEDLAVSDCTELLISYLKMCRVLFIIGEVKTF